MTTALEMVSAGLSLMYFDELIFAFDCATLSFILTVLLIVFSWGFPHPASKDAAKKAVKKAAKAAKNKLMSKMKGAFGSTSDPSP